MYRSIAPIPGLRAASDSYLFLTKQLETVDDVIREPLTGTDWPRDMPVITGGGITESIASIDVSYASSGGEEDGLFFEAANDIPVLQADMSKSVARTFNFAEYLSFPTMEDLIQCHKGPEPLKSKGLSDRRFPGDGRRRTSKTRFSPSDPFFSILSNDFKQSNDFRG